MASTQFSLHMLLLLLLLLSLHVQSGVALARDLDHGAVHGARWWILHRHHTNQLHKLSPGELQKWFTVRQWRQFKSLSRGRRGSRVISVPLFEAAVVGVKRALHECQRQFKYERWNCSLLETNQAGSIFGRLLLRGTPETGFVHAIVSAGIVQSVAESCLRMNGCPCDNRGRRKDLKGKFKWSGCDHNVWFGKRFARRMLDALEGRSHIRFHMNDHNSEAGRRNVVKHLTKSCRCHGTSGSCAMRTCIQKTPPMHRIGNILKKLYKEAVKVTQDNSLQGFDSKTEVHMQLSAASQAQLESNSILWRPNSISARNRRTTRRTGNLDASSKARRRKTRRRKRTFLLRADSRAGEPPGRTDLVYYEEVSQDFYCNSRPEWNVLGTRGRICNSTSEHPNNCRELCCNRGYLTRHKRVKEQCKCRFVWCCKVECNECEVLKRTETCA